MSDLALAELPTVIHGVIRTYIHPFELEIAQSNVSMLSAQWSAEQNLPFCVERAIVLGKFDIVMLETAAEHGDKEMAIVLLRHHALWLDDYKNQSVMWNVVATLTAFGDVVTPEMCGLRKKFCNRARVKGASRMGDLALMRQLYCSDDRRMYDAAYAVRYRQMPALELIVSWYTFTGDILEYAVRYGNTDVMRMARVRGLNARIYLRNTAIRYNQPAAFHSLMTLWEKNLIDITFDIYEAINYSCDAIVINMWNRSNPNERDQILGLIQDTDLQYRLF